jgi:hypothetical protein
MRRSCLALVSAGAAAAMITAGAPASDGRAIFEPCPTHGVRGRSLIVVVARSPGIVIETVDEEAGAGGVIRTYACYPPTGRRTFLADNPSSGERPQPHFGSRSLLLAGTFALYMWEAGEGDYAYTGVDLVDARTGKQATLTGRRGYVAYQPVVRLVLEPTGSIALSRRHEILVCRQACDIDTYPAPVGEHVQVIARDGGVDGRSLRATPRGIEWRQGGRWRHASLHG